VVLGAGLALRSPGNGRNADAAFAISALGAAEWRVAAVGIDVLPGAVVHDPEDVGILVQTQLADFVHDMADSRVILNDRISILALRERFTDKAGVRQVRLVQHRISEPDAPK
jgi:hypothetical protein